ncbi:hypothetical protein BN128_704 [Cronobacter sakazakii 696]|nr:hypothetical protein BN128_704 [Cronobacter sakazakii 696]
MCCSIASCLKRIDVLMREQAMQDEVCYAIHRELKEIGPVRHSTDFKL